MEITKAIEPNILQKTGKVISKTGKNIFTSIGNFISSIFNGIGQGLRYAFDGIGNTLASIGKGIGSLLTSIGNGYNQIANKAPGVFKNVLQGAGNGVSATQKVIGTLTRNIGGGIKYSVSSVGQQIGKTFNFISRTAKNIFVSEPTRIYEVRVVVLSPTSAKISWKTNNIANGKVNWGLDETYPYDIQSEVRTKNHEFILKNLKPSTQYHFEVMSHGKNYVYDANRKFKTPGK